MKELSSYDLKKLVKLKLVIDEEDNRIEYVDRRWWIFGYTGWIFIGYSQHPKRVSEEFIKERAIIKDGVAYRKPRIVFSFVGPHTYNMIIDDEEKARRTYDFYKSNYNLKSLENG